MPPSKPGTPVIQTPTPARTSPQWVSTSMTGLMPGTNLVPGTADGVFLASSEEHAAAFWRPTDRFLGYYRVLPEGEPVAVDSAPGIYRCARAMVVHEIDNVAAGRARHRAA